ncbi:2-keto-3-deoxygluconate permease [Caproiciproducens faecalis]|uniref:2-keto-3-deoxygluconate permease n=1 Tax=Caproiciproducens faecalis TaxID=2820301 RepID=A0ABS7DJA6_9FIRM|nr:2-keto-3-deoxygluconate permease [Caproiciproducens faecalis]MBW7571372.1 2-keto-3-deoxygluconate permease [Caproiciproducens faecalis]
MIMRFMKKVPAGLMVVPLILGCLVNTLFPEALKIGGITTALFSKAGSATALGMLLFCMGTKLQLKEMPVVLKRGGLLLFSKFAIGAALGILVGKFCGPAGFLGLSSLAIICAVTNSNGSIFFALMTEYGDEKDCACMPILAINDGPFLTLVALGCSGLANIPVKALVAAIIPILAGMILGNIDKEFKNFFGAASNALIPFNGFSLGAGISLIDVIKGGPSGVLLAFLTIFVGGIFIVLCDKYIGRRPGYAGWAVATTAGNAVAVPAVIATADVALQPLVASATVQVAASTVLSAIIVPFIVGWWAKKYGCPQFPLEKTEKAS